MEKSSNKNISLRLDGELKEKFRLACFLNDIKQTDYLKECIKKYVEENEEKIDKYINLKNN